MNRTSQFNPILLLAIALSANACSSDGDPSDDGSGGKGAGGTTVSGGSSSGGAGSGGKGGSSQGGAGLGSGGAGTGGAGVTGGTSGGPSGGKGGAAGTAGVGGATGGSGGTTGGAGAGGAGAAGGGAGGEAGIGAGQAGLGSGGTASGGGGQAGASGNAGGGSGGTMGGAAGTSTGGTGGSSGYNPCKASPCVVLPLGDSITHGFNSGDDGGYRTGLFKLAVADNKKVTFIGSLSNGPSTVSGQNFPKTHEGHDGISVTGITGWVPPARAFTMTPHIVLLHIGTNDMTSNANPTTTANQLDTLVTNLVEAAPDALIVVAKIVPLGYNNTNYDQYIAKIPGIVEAHAANDEHVVMVDMSTLPGSDIRGNGNVHPTDKGYSDMADLWYGVIEDYLPN